MKSSDDEYEIRSKFQQKIDYETVLLQQMGRIAQHRSSGDLKQYESSIDTLVLMLPSEVRNKAIVFKKENDISYKIELVGKKKYDILWEYINQLLEDNNLIYHTKYVKSYS